MVTISSLQRKLLRDLWALKTQVLSIALVIACGIGGHIASFSTYHSLVQSRDKYYDQARFPHLFAQAKRAPLSLMARILAVPGIAEAEARVEREAQLDIPGVVPPMIARIIGQDFSTRSAMNRLTLQKGRWPVPGVRDEVVVNDRFMTARGLSVGAQVHILLNGKLQRLTVVGTVLSPEYIFATRGGGMPDDEWFAVIWMDQKSLAAATNMESAFNTVVARLEKNASEGAAIAELDRLLTPYGGLGAVGRADQVSNRILSQELDQQQVWGTLLPAIFLLVAAFILNVVMHRQVNAQRSEIAALKALGYEDRWIAWHYIHFASVIVLLGIVFGLGLGKWLGSGMTRLYTDHFHFPEFDHRVPVEVVITGALVSFVAAYGGALAAIRGVLRLRPAEALRPPAPAIFRPLLLERLGYERVLTPSQRMIFRNLERKPVRAALTIAGIAASVAVLLSGTFWRDAVEHFMDIQFNKVQRGDVNLGFVEAVPLSAQRDLERLPGVRQAELVQSIPARLRVGHRSYRTAVTGVPDDGRLLRIIDADQNETKPGPGELILTSRLAERLSVVPGQQVRVELLGGKRLSFELPLAGVSRELAGMNAWMRREDLNRLAREGPVASTAQLIVDRAQEDTLLQRLKQIPAVAVVIVNRSLIETFRETSARNLIFFTSILTLFAATIAAGVVYNNARIQLAERAWELASLRVLGLTRAEVSVLLLGELAIEIALAIPIGFVLGFLLAAMMLAMMPHDVFEIPLIILPSTYVFAGAAVAVAGVLSALVVRHRIDHLDLVAVLKTRE